MESYENRELPMQGGTTRSPQELMDEFKSLIHQGQELLDATANLSGEALTTVRDRFQFKWDDARIKLSEVQSYTKDQSQHARELTGAYVHDHPWWAISRATGVGVLIGYSLHKRGPGDKENYTRH